MSNRAIALKFGDKDYIVPQLRSKASAAWRQTLAKTISELIATYGSIADYENVDLTDMNQIGGLVDRFGHLLYNATDVLVNLIVAYAPQLKKKDLEDAYDDELIDAFQAILKVAIPFDKLRSLFVGLSTPETSSN